MNLLNFRADSPPTPPDSPMVQYGALHLLIKHSGSRNPVSRRTNQSTAEYTPEDAMKEILQYVEKIKAEGATKEVFAKYAQERSDCGSYRQGGDLGMFGPGEMQKQFEDGTAATPVSARPTSPRLRGTTHTSTYPPSRQIGSMSPPVVSDSGTHLIFRYA